MKPSARYGHGVENKINGRRQKRPSRLDYDKNFIHRLLRNVKKYIERYICTINVSPVGKANVQTIEESIENSEKTSSR